MATWEVITVSTATTRYVVEAEDEAEAQRKVLYGELTEEEVMHGIADLGTDAEAAIDIKRRD